MRTISIDAIKEGEILAEPVMNRERNVLIPSGSVLKKEYIPLLKSFGITTLKVEDPYASYEVPNPIISPVKLQRLVSKARNKIENHIYHLGSTSLKEFEILATEIVRDINTIPEDTVFDMEQRTPDLYEHTVMVTLLSVMIAKKMNLSKRKQYNIAIGCLLHDIGIRYITVPYENRDIISYDVAEAFEYKKHTILGYSAVEDEEWIPDISRKMILMHHEKSDGSGFPMHQRTKEIECKIIQICDAFDCMISGMECNRTYVCKAVENLIQQSGKLYDETIVNCLISSIAKYPVGTTVKTNEKEQGIVISQTKDPLKPIIMIIDEGKEKTECKYNLMIEKDISILQVV